MNSSGQGPRGWPLLFLCMVLGSWALVRVVLWESPLAAPVRAALPQELATAPMAQKARSGDVARRDDVRPALRAQPAVFQRKGPVRSTAVPATEVAGPEPAVRASLAANGPVPASHGIGEVASQPAAPGVAHAPMASSARASSHTASRWSMDLWALWRDDTTTPITSGRSSYGRSQAGAVLRYRLGNSARTPDLYLRATRALDAGMGREGESEAAMGASVRPLANVPVRLAAEARVSETDSGTQLRGAAYAVTELPPVSLPAGLTGEAYLQGGYVTGTFATPFVDGQALVSREILRTGDLGLSVGAGAWGGAQEDAQRLDVGPSAGLNFRLARARGRISADYRIRVAGDAEPSSGPALTVTAGF